MLSLLLCFLVVPAPVDLATAAGEFFSLLLLVFVHDFEFCIDNVAFAAFTAAFFGRPTRTSFRSGLRTSLRASPRGRLLVKLGADFLELVLQLVVRALHRVGVVAIDRVPHRGDGIFNGFLFVSGNLVTEFFQLLLALIREHVSVVLDLDRFLRLLVLFGVRFSFTLHLLDLLLRKSGAAGNGNLLFLSGAEIFRRDVQNAVRVDVEGHLDLRNAARGRWNSVEMKRAELLIVARKRPFPLQYFDFHTWLIVAVG